MARWIESWMPGSAQLPGGGNAGAYPGERFGLPAEGVSSAAGFGRRFGALAVDWMLGYLIALLVSGPDPLAAPNFNWYVLGIWYLLTAVPVAIFGASAGMTALGIRVASIDDSVVTIMMLIVTLLDLAFGTGVSWVFGGQGATDR